MCKSLLVGCGNATCENRRIGSLRVRRSIPWDSRSYLASRPEPRKVIPLCALDRSNVKIISTSVLRFGEIYRPPSCALEQCYRQFERHMGSARCYRGGTTAARGLSRALCFQELEDCRGGHALSMCNAAHGLSSIRP